MGQDDCDDGPERCLESEVPVNIWQLYIQHKKGIVIVCIMSLMLCNHLSKDINKYFTLTSVRSELNYQQHDMHHNSDYILF